MSRLNPIYTEITECTDCNKCIRECPVKGIKVKEGHAFIEPELCILCGHCTTVCPRGAKKIRDDIPIAKKLVKSGFNIIASIAPSFVSEFPGITIEQLNGALKKLGFLLAEETALGAQLVSNRVWGKIKESKVPVISSACPVTNNYIKKYRPEFSDSIVNIDSPLIAHCKQIKQRFGQDAKVIFFGPCIGKKLEADNNPTLLNVALTFQDLTVWLNEYSIDLKEEIPVRIERKALNGKLYPIEGGMIKCLNNESLENIPSFAYSGLSTIKKSLDGLINNFDMFENTFFELLACDGGCINGPGANCHTQTAIKTLNIVKNSVLDKQVDLDFVNIESFYNIEPVKFTSFTEEEISTAMKNIGKIKKDDEINCGACGYSTCREFASAYLEGKAETTMCLNYLRKLSENKANTLIHTMPSGVIIVDNTLKIIESNRSFSNLMGDDYATIYNINGNLNNISLKKILPQYHTFQKCLETGKTSESIIKVKGRIIKCIVYSVVDYLVVGGIFRDITEPRIQREQIISKAQEVLTKNVATVQQIAYLLGESAAESEVMLNSIIDSFGQVEADDSGI